VCKAHRESGGQSLAVGGATTTDRDLIALCRTGSPGAYERLVETHYGYLLAHCMRITGNRAEAEDAVQEVLLRMVRSINRLDPQPSLRPWLRRVATNVCIDQAGRAERGGRVHSGDAELAGLADKAALTTADSDPVGRQVVERAEIAAVSEAMEGLGRTQRSVLLLRVVEGMSYDAISAALGLPIGTIKSHLSRARSQLRRALPDPGSS